MPKATEVGAISSSILPDQLTPHGKGPPASSLGTLGQHHVNKSMGTYHTSRRVHLAVRHTLEISGAAPVVPRAVTDWPKGGQQVIDGFEVGGQHCFFPWRKRGRLNPRGTSIIRFFKKFKCAFITLEIIICYIYNKKMIQKYI